VPPHVEQALGLLYRLTDLSDPDDVLAEGPNPLIRVHNPEDVAMRTVLATGLISWLRSVGFSSLWTKAHWMLVRPLPSPDRTYVYILLPLRRVVSGGFLSPLEMPLSPDASVCVWGVYRDRYQTLRLTDVVNVPLHGAVVDILGRVQAAADAVEVPRCPRCGGPAHWPPEEEVPRCIDQCLKRARETLVPVLAKPKPPPEWVRRVHKPHPALVALLADQTAGGGTLPPLPPPPALPP